MSRFIQNGNYDVTELDQEYFIFNQEQFTVTRLNQMGSFCWQQLEQAQTVDSLYEAVKTHFHVTDSEEVVKEDLAAFLLELENCRLLRHVS